MQQKYRSNRVVIKWPLSLGVLGNVIATVYADVSGLSVKITGVYIKLPLLQMERDVIHILQKECPTELAAMIREVLSLHNVRPVHEYEPDGVA